MSCQTPGAPLYGKRALMLRKYIMTLARPRPSTAIATGARLAYESRWF